jgi:hypothetical protein
MTRNPPWTDNENKAVVALYFAMLDKATSGEQYNKAAMIRKAQAKHPNGAPRQYGLHDRSRGSIEAKLMNCTAAHASFGALSTETMSGYGYRPLPNYQAALKEAMRHALNCRFEMVMSDAESFDELIAPAEIDHATGGVGLARFSK